MDVQDLTPSLCIRTRQRAVIEQMLTACTPTPDALDDSSDVWKVLIYDKTGRDIIAPLMRVPDLRASGVTLHMMLHAVRHPIPDVPAVYIVQPTRENINRIIADANKSLYSTMWLNFTDSISRELLENLAEGVASISNPSPLAGRVARVYDMYSSFLALESNLFSLNIPKTFATLNAAKATNIEVQTCISAIVNRLFCVVVTLGVVPIIRAQKGGPAYMVATSLEQRIREHLVASNNIFSEAVSFTAAPAARPILVLLDRSIDIPVMLHHTWTYQALSHDILDLTLNRVSIPVKDNLMSQGKKRTFDMDKRDAFWADNAGLPFPMVAEAIETSLQAYKDEVANLSKSTGEIGDQMPNISENDASSGAAADKLSAAISNIPELAKKKRMIDLHTNIGTALLDQIKDRGLDGYFQIEEELLSRPSTFDVEKILALLRDMKGLPTDKLRLFLIYYLCVDSASTQDLSRCVTVLEEAGCNDFRAYKYLQSIRAFTKSISQVSADPITASASIGGGYAASVFDTLSQVANNVNKLIISADKALASARVVQTLMDQKGDAEILSSYEILDPKAPKGSRVSSTATRPCNEAILFVVGPGNYIEYQNCQDQVCSIVKQEGKESKMVPNGKTVIYGATELYTGVEFLNELHRTGDPQDAPATNGTAKA